MAPELAEQLEGLTPEAERDDVRLPGEQVVGDVESAHGREVSIDDPLREVLDENRGLVAPFLNLAQHGAPPIEEVRVGLIPRGDRDIDARAVVVERLARQRFDAELANPDHDVRDLDSGVVDVVVHLHGAAGAPEDTGNGVADARVAQMPDVSRLVGIGGRVLDERLPGGRLREVDLARCLEIGRRREHRRRPGTFVEMGVDVARGGHCPCAYPRHARRLQVCRQVGGDGDRGTTQDTCEPERRRRRPVAELRARRALDHHLESGVHPDGVKGAADGLDQQRPGVRHIAQG